MCDCELCVSLMPKLIVCVSVCVCGCVCVIETQLQSLVYGTDKQLSLSYLLLLFHHLPHTQYTCIAASPNYIALGANTGGVYCFHRDGPRYIRLLANKVTRIHKHACTQAYTSTHMHNDVFN